MQQVFQDEDTCINHFRLLRWPDAKADRTDGLRLDWADCWLHVRPSNTEPIVRVIAEAPLEDNAKVLCRGVGALMTA